MTIQTDGQLLVWSPDSEFLCMHCLKNHLFNDIIEKLLMLPTDFPLIMLTRQKVM